MAKNNEKYAYLNRLSTEQLEELLRADMEASKPGNDEAVFHILEVIEQRENQQPTGRIPDVEEAWKEFQREYDLPEGEGMSLYPCVPEGEENSAPPVRRRRSAVTHQPRLHRRVKQSLAALTAVVALVCGMAAAQAAGFDVLGSSDREFPVYSSPAQLETGADAVIDFSSPAALDGLLEFGRRTKTPLILATTGYTPEQVAQVAESYTGQYLKPLLGK